VTEEKVAIIRSFSTKSAETNFGIEILVQLTALHEQMTKLRAVHQADGFVVLIHIQIVTRRLHGLHLDSIRLYHLGQEIHVLTVEYQREGVQFLVVHPEDKGMSIKHTFQIVLQEAMIR
jgi:hypothetical protein